MRRKEHLSGPFDWLKKFLPPLPGPKSQLPVVRQPMLPAETKEVKRVLAFFKPKSKQEAGTLIQFPAFMKAILPAFAPKKPKAETQPEKPVWKGLFQPQPVQEQTPEENLEKAITNVFGREPEPTLPTAEMFEFLKPSAQRESILHTRPQEWQYGEPPIWTTTRWQMPTTYELAYLIRDRWNIDEIFEYVLQNTSSSWWRRQVEESPHTGEPAALDVNQITTREPPYNDMGTFLNIPDYVIERYGMYGNEGLERFTDEVLEPMKLRIAKAMDVFKPTPELRGWFEIEMDSNSQFWLRYKEAKFSQMG